LSCGHVDSTKSPGFDPKKGWELSSAVSTGSIPAWNRRQRDAVIARGKAAGGVPRSLASENQNMRAPLSPFLLAAACLAAAGCASVPKEVSPVAANEPACEHDAADPMHMVSSRPDTERDWQIEAIMSQQPADPRLVLVNRQMYLSLHALDVELRREQRIAECEDPESSPPTLEAEAGDGAGPGSGAAAEADGAPGGPVGAGGGAGGYPMGGGASPASGAPPVAARSTLDRKTSLSATGGGGNGATAQKVNAASDNDIVARRLRKAAEQETDPALRAKMWKEYADYRQGMTGK
jgi:hypothetical protein